MIIDPTQASPKDVHKLLIGAVVPRPIAWVASLSAAGTTNLAPFSYFNIACSEPPMLLFCPQHRADGSRKDTLVNVEATREFVLHIVSEELAEVMNETSGDYPAGISELERIGLDTLPGERVAPPRIAAAPVAFECRVEQIMYLGGAAVVIGRVVLAHVRDDVYHDGYILLDALKPIARLAGNDYARVTETFTLARPRIDRATGERH